jgi:hypothetical protein
MLLPLFDELRTWDTERSMNFRRQSVAWVASVSLAIALHSGPESIAQTPGTPAATPAATSGGVIHGSVKAGTIPLPGVSVTATNTLTGKKYTTTTDVTGAYSDDHPAEWPLCHPRRTGRLCGIYPGSASQRDESRPKGGFRDDSRLASSPGRSRSSELDNTEDPSGAQASRSWAQASDLLQAGGAAANSGARFALDGGQCRPCPTIPSPSADKPEPPIPSLEWATSVEGMENQQQLQALGQTPGTGRRRRRLLRWPRRGFRRPGGGGGGRGGGRGNFRNFKPNQPHGAIFWNGGNSDLQCRAFRHRGQAQPNPAMTPITMG